MRRFWRKKQTMTTHLMKLNRHFDLGAMHTLKHIVDIESWQMLYNVSTSSMPHMSICFALKARFRYSWVWTVQRLGIPPLFSCCDGFKHCVFWTWYYLFLLGFKVTHAAKLDSSCFTSALCLGSFSAFVTEYIFVQHVTTSRKQFFIAV